METLVLELFAFKLAVFTKVSENVETSDASKVYSKLPEKKNELYGHLAFMKLDTWAKKCQISCVAKDQSEAQHHLQVCLRS